jgi:hypothetical protein
VFAAISDYLKSELGNGISNLVQPDKLIAATLFLFLNVIDIILNSASFRETFQPLYAAFISLDPLAVGIIFIVIVLVLSFLLLSFNTAITKLFTGEIWQNTWVGNFFTDLQKTKRDNLIAQSKGAEQKNVRANLQLITSFPREQGYIYPTELGNVQSATASYIRQHYGIEMAALVTHMESVIDTADATLSSRIGNEKSLLDFLVNMTFLLLVFAIELIVQLGAFLPQWYVILPIILLIFILSVITYKGAIVKARSWGDAVQMAFDLHCDDLRQKLGIRACTSKEDERQVWKQVSSLLLWGIPAEDVFDMGASPSASTSGTSSGSAANKADTTNKTGSTPSGSAANKADATNKTGSTPSGSATSASAPASVATVKTTANVQADIQSTIIDIDSEHPIEIKSPDGVLKGVLKVSQYIDYFLVVSNPTEHAVKDVFLQVADSRIPVIYEEPTVKVVGRGTGSFTVTPLKVIPTIWPGDNDRIHQIEPLIWHLTEIPAHSSLAITYQVPSHMFAAITDNNMLLVRADATPCEETKAIDYKIVIEKVAEVTEIIEVAKIAEVAEVTEIIEVIEVTRTGKIAGTLEVFDSSKTLSDTPKYGYVCDDTDSLGIIIKAKKRSTPDRYCWDLSALDTDTHLQNAGTLTLTYTV